jgi:triosephosphate isomerase
MIFINLKTYKEASGEGAVNLAGIAKEVENETSVKIIVCPQAVDIKQVLQEGVGVWAQNIDAKKRGRATGWFPAEIAKEVGVEGTLLNHSEHKISVGELGEALSSSKDAGLKTLVFADSLEEARIVANLQPDFIGYEPPELIASPDTSVARAKPEVIRDVVQALPGSKVIVGAGIKDEKDVEVSIKLGATGIALASAVVLADNPKSVLTRLAQGFRK